MGSTKLTFRIIFHSVALLVFGTATYWLYTHSEHAYHAWYLGTGMWALALAADIADDLHPEGLAPWRRRDPDTPKADSTD